MLAGAGWAAAAATVAEVGVAADTSYWAGTVILCCCSVTTIMVGF